MLSAEKLGEVWAGRSVEGRWQCVCGYLVCFRAQNSSCKILNVYVHGYVQVCIKHKVHISFLDFEVSAMKHLCLPSINLHISFKLNLVLHCSFTPWLKGYKHPCPTSQPLPGADIGDEDLVFSLSNLCVNTMFMGLIHPKERQQMP